VTRTSGTALAVAIGNAMVSGISYSIAAGTVGVGGSTTGTIRIAVDTSVTPPVGRVIYTTGLTGVTCSGMSGCTTPVIGSAFGPDDLEIAIWTVTTGAFDILTASSTDLRAVVGGKRVVAGSGLSSTTSGHTETISVDHAADTFGALTDGATITWSIGSAFVANATVTLGGNRTLNITSPVNGGDYVLKVVQDGTGSRTLTLGTGCTWKVSGGGSGAIVPTTTAAAVDILTFTYDGTNCYATFTKNFN
jgi:hypothetical protein